MIKKLFRISKSVALAIWEIEEGLEVLSKGFDPNLLETIAHFHPEKKAEFIASRKLMESMCEEMEIPFHGICKDAHGKPHLVQSSHHISISHSYPKITGLINLNFPCGIDIEKPRTQLIKIKHKFLNEKELDACQDQLDLLCMYWSAKETIYKIHGRKNLSFKQNIEIRKIQEDKIYCRINKNGESSHYVLIAKKEGDFFVIHSL